MAVTANAEFTIKSRYESDRRGAVKWLYSHARRYWWLWIVALGGATGSALLAAYTPMLIGQAFNAILNTTPPDLDLVAQLAIFIVVIQLVRGILQLGRNFGAELLAQTMERDVRDELYVSLLGKSMTFHNLQPVGDTMARATNDVREVNFMFSPGLSLVIGSLNFLIMPLIVAPRIYPVACDCRRPCSSLPISLRCAFTWARSQRHG